MTQLMRAVVISCAAVFFMAGAAQAQTPHSDEHAIKAGSAVTLTSCVAKGEKDKTYVLTHVADIPSSGGHMGHVVYWLDKDTAERLGPHVGHQIRVIGKVDGIESREMEMKTDDGSLIVEVEGPGRDVRTTPDKVNVPTARARSGRDMKTTLVKLKVEKLEMVAANCPLAR